jgi:hypothetical protein
VSGTSQGEPDRIGEQDGDALTAAATRPTKAWRVTRRKTTGLVRPAGIMRTTATAAAITVRTRISEPMKNCTATSNPSTAPVAMG